MRNRVPTNALAGHNRMSHAELARAVYASSWLKGEFLLRSGATSSEYFDKYRFEADPRLLAALAAHMAPLLPQDAEVLAGLELGGIPIAVALGQVTNKPVAFVRKQAKEYGTCRLAEGAEVSGHKVVVVEDVVTSGGQVLESCAQLRGLGALVEHVICVIDRESGGDANLRREGLRLVAAFTMSELKNAGA